MGHRLIRHIQVSKIASTLNEPWSGKDLEITEVQPLCHRLFGSLCFSNTPEYENTEGAVIIAPHGSPSGNGAVINSKNPRLTFARALHLINQNIGFEIDTKQPELGKNVAISPSAIIGLGVSIGAGTIVEHNVVIAEGVAIGEDCHIKSNSVIGEAGFGFERDENGIPLRILHLGSVLIGNRVEIGSLNTVCKGTLGNTVIEDDVKFDDHVHVAHNCRIRRGAILTACVELSGGVDVGEFGWIGPNSSVKEKITLGNRSFVGIASNVTKSIPEMARVAGNPARLLR